MDYFFLVSSFYEGYVVVYLKKVCALFIITKGSA